MMPGRTLKSTALITPLLLIMAATTITASAVRIIPYLITISPMGSRDLILKFDIKLRMLIRKFFKKGIIKNVHVYDRKK